MLRISKKILSVLMVILLVTTAVSLSSFVDIDLPAFDFGVRATALTEGYYTYEVSDNKVTITGCDRSIEGNVVIPDKLGGIRVTAIGEKAFYNCSGITTVTIDDNIKSIGKAAFAHCYAISEVILPDCIEEMADETFNMCFNLAKVSLSKTNIKRIGAKAFAYCEFLETVTLPDTLETVGAEAFRECGNLQSVIIGKGAANIEKDAFAKCYNLFNVYYMGTEEQWDQIIIGSNNSSLLNATIHFNHKHNYYLEKVVSPTCTKMGEEWYVCNCGDSYRVDIPALGHIAEMIPMIKATCTEAGKTAGEKCSRCGVIIADPGVIPAQGHKVNLILTKEATCTEKGKQSAYCSACKQTVSEDIPALGHTDVDFDSKCDRCGAVNELPQPENPSDNCSCNCHKSGLSNFIFKIMLFFQKIFKINKICVCGVEHY